jgi:Na+/H+ antiporter NhaD/arsenite permease-like protein
MWGVAALGASLVPAPAWAASAGAAPALPWGIPFAGLLLSIAILPLIAPHFWHRRMGLVAIAWVAALAVPQIVLHGLAATAAEEWHAVLLEYLPFVTLLLALFTVGGGILLTGGPWGTPTGNTLLLAVGTALAGVMGTTGVSMVLIHPLLRANAHRRRRVHIVVFFIILCANAGGATSPLGDPPLYIGFLQGVPFLWPLQNLLRPLLLIALPLLAAFWAYDAWCAAHEPARAEARTLRLRGWPNVALIAVVVAAVIVQGVWHPGDATLFGQAIAVERLAGMGVFIAIAALSLRITPESIRNENLFTWAPMEEVGKLFLAIFITIAPVLDMLAAGADGPVAPVFAVLHDADGKPWPMGYLWATGLFSAFLDNAPTYLLFFQLAGNDAELLTGALNKTLRAIAGGAVFFGALTYIGNAPNMMVRSIAAHRGIRMPGFFGYIGIAGALLLPLFAFLSYFVFG